MNNKMNNKINNKRIKIVIGVFYFGFILLIVNLFKIQIIEHKNWKKIAYKQYYTKEYLEDKRGQILTYDKKEIAYDLESYILILDPFRISDKYLDEISSVISSVLNLNEEELKNKIKVGKENKRRYLNISNNVFAEEKEEIYNLLIKDKKKLERESIISGVFFKEDTIRILPELDLFKNIIGFINIEKEGMYGIERTYNSYLKGTKGYSETYLSTHNKFELPLKNQYKKVEAKDGNNVILTIDYVMQHILDENLYKTFIETNAEWAAGVIVSPKNGKILAMSSFPVSDRLVDTRNNVIYNQYEPGSVFKPIIASMALNEGVIDENSRFYSTGRIKKYNTILKDHGNGVIGNLSISDIIEKSSNVGMIMIGDNMTNQTMYNGLLRYGFNEKTDIELSGERDVSVPNLANWSGLTKPTISFGQGIVVTPIQMVMGFAAVINGGYLYKPIIVDRVETPTGEIVLKNNPQLKRRVFENEKISETMRLYLERAVANGTGKGAYIEGYNVGGKTGTSQKAGKGGYARGKYIASFAGFFPSDDPEYLCLIVVDEPKRKIYGGEVAAPVAKKVFERIIKYKNIIPNNIKEKIIYLKDDEVQFKTLKIDTEKNIMPNFVGYSLRDALEFFSETNYEIIIKGSGKIKSHEPKSGSCLDKVQKVYLNLEEM